MFAPEARLTPHFALMAVVGRTMEEAGHVVRFVECRNTFTRCVPKFDLSAPLREPRSPRTCRGCPDAFERMAAEYSLSTIGLARYVTDETRGTVRRIMDEWSGRLGELRYDGINVGLLCEHDLSITQKLQSASGLTEELQAWFADTVETALLALIGTRQMLREEGFTHVFLYGQYSINMVVYQVARQLGIEPRILTNPSHRGVNRQHCVVRHHEGPEYWKWMLGHWDQWRHLVLERHQVDMMSDDALDRVRASTPFTYSPPKTMGDDGLGALQLRHDRRLIAVFTSSPDEIVGAAKLRDAMERTSPAHTPPLFEDQRTWLRHLVEFVAPRNDLQMVIRIHPREDANHRDGVASEHLDVLRAALADLPDNVKVVWPRDPVSSYDLIEASSLVLTSWSSLSVEATCLGTPVLSAFPSHALYPCGGFIHSADSIVAYDDAIDRLLDQAPTLDDIAEAFRWGHHCLFAASVPIDDVVPDSGYLELPPYRFTANVDELMGALFESVPIEERRRRAISSAVSPATLHEERDAVRRHLMRVLHFLFTGELLEEALPSLAIRWDAPDAAIPDDGFALFALDGRCEYRAAGRRFCRRSPLAERIGRILGAQEAATS